MDVFNKLKNSVSSTVSQLSGVLPGNPVTREFEVNKHIASYGPGLLWKVYSGYKKSTKQEASIFVLEKRMLEVYGKRDRDRILEDLKKGVHQLTRLRHPRILTVQHPLEESRESLAFATEPVFTSLANALGNQENMPVPPPAEMKDYKLFEVEIKYGLLQLSEALIFLHNDVKLLHRNICPESIVLNKSGAWKIAGFDYCLPNSRPSDQEPLWEFQEWEANLHPHAQPHLDYLAPEYALTLSSDPASDMYSLGVLVYAIFNNGKPLFANSGSFTTFKRNACELKSLPSSLLNGIPIEVREHTKMLLNATSELRPDAHQFSKIPFFDDVGAKTLHYLDSLYQWDNLQKSQFYKGLPQIITKLPKRVNLHRILPCLCKEFVNPEMVPFVLPNVLLISEDVTNEEFCQFILPDLRIVFRMQEPIQILLIFLQKMHLLLTKTPAEDIKVNVLPIVYRSLESDAQQIQELSLSIIPEFAGLIDYPSMKNALLPKIKRLCLGTAFLSVRVNCLVCLGKLLDHLDKWLVLDDILPMLPEIPSREPAVLMGILGIYKLTMNHKKLGITKEILANKVVPFLMPLSIENGLTLAQYDAVMAVIREMIGRVETEHRGKLEQLNSIQKEQRSAMDMSKVQMPKKDQLIGGLESKPVTELDEMFGNLGLGGYLNHKEVGKPLPTEPQLPPASKGSLSLEEKQRLANQMEQQHRMKTQQPIPQAPPSITAPMKPPERRDTAPKDLTSTLINNNLMNLSVNKPNPNYTLGQIGQINKPSPNYNLDPISQINPQPNFAGIQQQNSQMIGSGVSGFPAIRPPPQAGWGFPRPPGMMPAPPPLQQQAPRMDLSAFDNLLQTSSSKPKVSMNQMMNSRTFEYGDNSAASSVQKTNGAATQSNGSSNQFNDLLG